MAVEIAILDKGPRVLGQTRLAVSMSERSPDMIAGRSMSSSRCRPLLVRSRFTSKKKSYTSCIPNSKSLSRSSKGKFAFWLNFDGSAWLRTIGNCPSPGVDRQGRQGLKRLPRHRKVLPIGVGPDRAVFQGIGCCQSRTRSSEGIVDDSDSQRK